MTADGNKAPALGFFHQISLAVSYAMRDMRAGLRGFYIFVCCLILGVASIAIIGSLSSAIETGMAQQGRPLLGGDLEFALVHRETTPAEADYLAELGQVGVSATMRAITASASARSLIELKAVDDLYPLYGAVKLESGRTLDEALAKRQDNWGVVIEAGLARRLGVKPGDSLSLGNLTFTLRDLLIEEPDRVSSGFILAPRLMISIEALRASGLAAPGSLVRWRYKIKLPENSIAAARLLKQAERDLPDAGWRIRTSDTAAPAIARFLERLTFFLTLVGLTALIVGGVGIANGVTTFLSRRRDAIAMLKCLGAPAALVFQIYFIEMLAISSLAIIAGVVLGAAAPVFLNGIIAGLLPVPVALTLALKPLLMAAAMGYLVAIAFSLWPLAKAGRAPAKSLFSPAGLPLTGTGPGWPAIAASIVAFLALGAMVLVAFPERHISLWYMGGVGGSFMVLLLLGQGVMQVAKRWFRTKRATTRLAVANLYRPGAPTPSVILSLGLGLAVFVTLSLVDINLSRELRSNLPEDAPDFFFFDVQNHEKQDFIAHLRQQPGIEALNTAPMLRGRIMRINGVAAKDIKISPDAAWALRGDRGLTYAQELPENASLVKGDWWPKDYDGEPLVSFTEDIANAMGLKLGDSVTINVLGRPITAKVANFRTVDWRSLEINFVMMFSPNTLQAAPHGHIVTLSVADAHEPQILDTVNASFPTIAAVRVRDAVNAISEILASLLAAIRVTNVITFSAGLLVLAGALAASLNARIYDATVLKTYGATRRQLIAAFALEYGLLGAISALFAVIIGSIASWAILKYLLEAPWSFAPVSASLVAFAAMAITIGIGLLITRRSLKAKPARILRTE